MARAPTRIDADKLTIVRDLFIAMFGAVLVYALRPRNGPTFDMAQRRALDLDQPAGRGRDTP